MTHGINALLKEVGGRASGLHRRRVPKEVDEGGEATSRLRPRRGVEGRRITSEE